LAELGKFAQTAAAAEDPDQTPTATAGTETSFAALSYRTASAGIVLGLADHPERQAQEALRWDPSGGHLAILGTPRSGRTVAAVTAAAGLADTNWATHVVTHQIGAFVNLTAKTSFASLIDATELERFGEMLCLIEKAKGPQAIVLDAPALLDGIVVSSLNRPLLEALTLGAIAANAALVITGPPKAARWLSACPHRLVLGPVELADDLALGVPRELAGGRVTPGRACYLGGGAAFIAQIAQFSPGQATPDSRLAPPGRVLPLPRRVCQDDLPANAANDGVWVGLGGRYGTPVALPLPPGRPVAVIGPHGSGRTTALAAIRKGLQAANRECALFGDCAPKSWSRIVEVLDAEQVALVDDLETVTGPPPSCLPPNSTLVASYTTATALSLRPPLHLFQNNPLGVLLWPSSAGGSSAFGPAVRSGPPLQLGGPRPVEPPGRGRLVDGGRSWAVQLSA
jgi:S-DNA-T family DNA segregation ATPase FtsK/SpoIIIE